MVTRGGLAAIFALAASAALAQGGGGAASGTGVGGTAPAAGPIGGPGGTAAPPGPDELHRLENVPAVAQPEALRAAPEPRIQPEGRADALAPGMGAGASATMTEAEVRAQLRAMGFREIGGLERRGAVWRGEATRDGARERVTVDPRTRTVAIE